MAVVREAAEGVGSVTDRAWRRALDAGWTDVELAEAFGHLAVNLFTDYFNHYAQTELDLPEAPPLAG